MHRKQRLEIRMGNGGEGSIMRATDEGRKEEERSLLTEQSLGPVLEQERKGTIFLHPAGEQSLMKSSDLGPASVTWSQSPDPK